MSNGIGSNPALNYAAAVFLTVLIVSSGGCDTGAAPRLPSQPAGDTQESQAPNARYRMDPARNRMWVLTDDGVFLYDTTTPRMIAEVDLPGWQEVDAQYSCPADLALGPSGEALITSNVVPTLWRIDPETLAVSVHEIVLDTDRNKDVGFSGLTYSVEHGAFFALSGAHGSFWRIDRSLREGRKMAQLEPVRDRCSVALPRAE